MSIKKHKEASIKMAQTQKIPNFSQGKKRNPTFLDQQYPKSEL